jgi:hypothetical protein
MVSFRFGQSFVSQPHGHMDAGNVEFEAFGVPLLSDSGSYAYGPGPWRAFVKSSAAHNVVTIDGAEYQRERVSPLLSSTSNRHYAMFSADLQVIEGATWRRTVLHSKRGHWILVDDQVTGVGSNLVTQRWNLPDDQQYRIDQGRSVTQTSGTVKIDLRFLAGSPDLKIRTGWAPPEKPRMVGWRSFGYGTIEPSPTLEASARTGTWHGVTLISARGGSAGPGVTVSDVTVSTSGVAATVSSGGLKERVSLLPWRLTTRDLT